MLGSYASDVFAGKPTSRLRTSNDGVGLQVISIKDIGTSIASSDQLEIVHVASIHEVEKFKVKLNDVVVTSRGSVRSAVVREEHVGALLGTNLVVVRLLPSIPADAVAAYLRHPDTENILLSDFAGSVTPGFSVSALKRLPIEIPSHDLMESLSELVKSTDRYCAAVESSAQLRRRITLESVYRALRKREGEP